MMELLASLARLTKDELIVRAVSNNDLMLQNIEGYSRAIVRSDIDWRSHDHLVELVARQERILTKEGIINNAERVARPT